MMNQSSSSGVSTTPAVDQLNLLKEQEELIKNQIKLLEDQKERLMVEETNLIELLKLNIRLCSNMHLNFY